MSENLLFSVGTLLSWVGFVLLLVAAARLLHFVTSSPAQDRIKILRSVAISGVAGAVSVIVAASIMKVGLPPGDGATGGLRVPLVWFVMPFTVWLAVLSWVLVVVRGLQAAFALDSVERLAKLRSLGIWLAIGLVCAFLYRRSNDPITVLKGSVHFGVPTIIGLIGLAVAAGAVMGLATRYAHVRGWAKSIMTHAALIAGSIVFGIPFAWALITSFKEDRDMSSPDGIVWIPRVQQTVEYMDKKDPLYEGTFRDRTVYGSILTRNTDGTVTVAVSKPPAYLGYTYDAKPSELKEVAKEIPLVSGSFKGQSFRGKVIEELPDGGRRVEFMAPDALAGQQQVFQANQVDPIRNIGLRTRNYSEALDYLPAETNRGLVYLKNTLIITILSVIGAVFSSSIVAYAFARMRFPFRDTLFGLVLATMMLPAAVTMLPQFLIFRSLGWIDTLYPLWVPAFFASAFNVFLLRQFFKNVPMELEDAAKIDGCNPPRTFWSIMLPQVKPALAVIAVTTFVGAWNNFIGPLIYINSPENMPLSYALQLFQGERSGEPGLLMAFATMTMLPVLALFFFAQRYFVEGVTLSGLGGR